LCREFGALPAHPVAESLSEQRRISDVRGNVFWIELDTFARGEREFGLRIAGATRVTSGRGDLSTGNLAVAGGVFLWERWLSVLWERAGSRSPSLTRRAKALSI
jgi:hypothetical protein